MTTGVFRRRWQAPPRRRLPFTSAGGASQSWTGTAGTVTVTGAVGAFTADAATWTGTPGTITVTGSVGAFTPGAATWTGTPGTIVITGAVGTFSGSTVPDAPTAVVVQAGDTKVAVRWTAPVGDGGSPITGYLVERNVNGGGWVTAVADTGTTREWYFDTGRTNGLSVIYRISAINSVGTGAASTASAGATPLERLFPSGVDAGDRYLIDQNSDPFYLIGDTAWSAVGQLTSAKMREYLDDRSTRGFNVVVASIPEPHYTSQTPDDENVEGERPFTGTAFQSTLNETYWELADYFVKYAEVLGITILLCPAYLGFADSDGWGGEVDSASSGQMSTYGGYIDARYSSADNVIYLLGHDRNPSASQITKYKALTDALTSPKLVPGSHHEAGSHVSLMLEEWTAGATYAASAFLAEMVYDYDLLVVANGEDAWGNDKTYGFFEGRYEQGFTAGTTLAQLRFQTWGSFVAGAAFAVFGNNPIWHFSSTRGLAAASPTDWESHLGGSGTLHQVEFIDFLATVTDWHTMVPDTGDTFLVSGANTGSDQAGARFNADGAIVYMPTTRAVDLDLSEFAAGWDDVTVTRIDPTDGATSVLGTYNTTETAQTIASQGNNAAGTGNSDWVLYVEGNTISSTVWTGTPGTTTITGAVGAFVPGAATWTGTAGTITVIGAVGSFTPGAATWTGTAGTITVTGNVGAFLAGDAPQSWSGTSATTTITGSVGAFTPGAATWTGTAGTVTVTGSVGAFSAGALVWSGTPATTTVTGSVGAFVPGTATWTGTAGTVTVAGAVGAFTGGTAIWSGTVGTITVTGGVGAFVDGTILLGGLNIRYSATARRIAEAVATRISSVTVSSR